MANKYCPAAGCTIEAEPRTLTGGKLSSVREAAKGVAETKEVAKASDVFTEGMWPVVSIKTMGKQIEIRDQVFGHLIVGINGATPTTEIKQWTSTLPAAAGTPSLVLEEIIPQKTKNIAD